MKGTFQLARVKRAIVSKVISKGEAVKYTLAPNWCSCFLLITSIIKKTKTKQNWTEHHVSRNGILEVAGEMAMWTETGQWPRKRPQVTLVRWSASHKCARCLCELRFMENIVLNSGFSTIVLWIGRIMKPDVWGINAEWCLLVMPFQSAPVWWLGWRKSSSWKHLWPLGTNRTTQFKFHWTTYSFTSLELKSKYLLLIHWISNQSLKPLFPQHLNSIWSISIVFFMKHLPGVSVSR